MILKSVLNYLCLQRVRAVHVKVATAVAVSETDGDREAERGIGHDPATGSVDLVRRTERKGKPMI